LEEHIINM